MLQDLLVITCILNPLETPFIVVRPSDTEATYGDTVLLTCVAFGDPLPTFYWLHNSQPVENSTDSTTLVFDDYVTEYGITFVRSILQLCSVTFEAEGYYTCVANNSAGVETANTSLQVISTGMYMYMYICIYSCACTPV